jgi:hypothetical protein
LRENLTTIVPAPFPTRATTKTKNADLLTPLALDFVGWDSPRLVANAVVAALLWPPLAWAMRRCEEQRAPLLSLALGRGWPAPRAAQTPAQRRAERAHARSAKTKASVGGNSVSPLLGGGGGGGGGGSMSMSSKMV